MKKAVETELNKIADTIPIVFDWVLRPEEFTGEELNLTPYGDIQTLIKDQVYTIPMPALFSVDHHKQVKEAYKRGGVPAVRQYCKSVTDKIQTK